MMGRPCKDSPAHMLKSWILTAKSVFDAICVADGGIKFSFGKPDGRIVETVKMAQRRPVKFP